MASKKNDLAARAGKLAPRHVPTPKLEEQQPRPVTRKIRAKPIRLTFDLAPNLHRDLGAFSQQAAERLGRPRVPNADIIRALLTHLANQTPQPVDQTP